MTPETFFFYFEIFNLTVSAGVLAFVMKEAWIELSSS